MVVLLAVVGLIAGILAGLFNPAGSGQDPGQGLSQRRGGQSTTSQSQALPGRFYTVVLASIPRSRERSEAEARAETFRNQGVKEVGVLDPQRYSSLNSGWWAIYSGVFQDDRDAAAARRDELRDRFPSAYVKLVRNES
jgi:SPOR domain